MRKKEELYTQGVEVEKHSQYIYTEDRKINGINTETTTFSPYPIPWDFSSNRPEDYYEQQSKIIRYYKEDIDQDNNPIYRKIEIKIPTVKQGKNRERVVSVIVDDAPFVFKDDGLLDMNGIFQFSDANLLMHLVNNNSNLGTNLYLQAIAPFVYLSGVREDEDYEFNSEKNGDIDKLLFPFIEEMSKLNGLSLGRELLIPVITKGEPHHWNFCLLSIDKTDTPSLYYIESANILEDFGYRTYLFYMNDYKKELLPCINSLLTQFKYQEIADIKYCQAKQFSMEGCGIAMSLNMQKILEGQYPKVICNSSSKHDEIPWSKIKTLSSNISIEEDIITRVEFAFKIQARESIIIEQDHDEDLVKVKSLSCREILAHPQALKAKAKEAFRFFKPLILNEEFNIDSQKTPEQLISSGNKNI